MMKERIKVTIDLKNTISIAGIADKYFTPALIRLKKSPAINICFTPGEIFENIEAILQKEIAYVFNRK